MTKKIAWIVIVVLAIIIGFYPGIYFFLDKKFGLLSTKSDQVLSNTFWNIGFYIHIILGGLALLVGWTQFSAKIRTQKLNLHRKIGKFYVIAVLLSSIGGIYIGLYATGGWISSLGFITLGVIWFYTTLMAYIAIKNKQIIKHQKMMIYSYAACFSAVTLRIWLPLLTFYYGDFVKAYIIVAWLCWVPNITVAYFINKKFA